jgi:hypothetical protein
MKHPRLTVLVDTRDGRRMGFHLDLPAHQVPVVAGLMHQMADALLADHEAEPRDLAPASTPRAPGR